MGRHFSNKYQEKLDSWCHVLMPYINGPFAFQPLEHFIETVAGWISTGTVEHCCTFHQSQSRAPPLKPWAPTTLYKTSWFESTCCTQSWKIPRIISPKPFSFSTQSTVAGFHWRPILLEALKRAFPRQSWMAELEERANLLQCNSVTSPLAKISAEL